MRMDDVARIALKCFPDTQDQVDASLTDEMREVLGTPIHQRNEVFIPFKGYPRTYLYLEYAFLTKRVFQSNIIHVESTQETPLDVQIKLGMEYVEYLLCATSYDYGYLYSSLTAYDLTTPACEDWPLRTTDPNVYWDRGVFHWKDIP